MSSAEPVIIVHGLWVHGWVMGWLAQRIAQCGFATHTYSYPSMHLTLSENAERLARYCEALQVPRVHLVGHSLGGLIALRMLEMTSHVRCGQLVLAGVPYRDSLSARRLAQFPGGAALLGHSIEEWLRGPPLEIHAEETGVIAGSYGWGLGRLIAPDLPCPNDGVITLAETEIPGVTRRVVLEVSHSTMLISAEVARQCCAFLRNGQFEPVASS